MWRGGTPFRSSTSTIGSLSETRIPSLPRPIFVLGGSENKVPWHPVAADFARYYGLTPGACLPSRLQTKRTVESSVKYVERDKLEGPRFAS
jgi:hypothetical protein